jgi:SAM-dependent methyltransferase
MSASQGPSPAAAEWDHEWQVAWKAHPRNPWFEYQAEAHARWLRARIGTPGSETRVLKTDAFDEACGFRSLTAALDGLHGVLIDVSPRIVARATERRGRGRGTVSSCATDVRRLGLGDGAFDLVVSPSTLDHFAEAAEIGESVRELARVLKPEGRLLLTLDNPHHPVVRLRNWVHRRTGPVGGLIPFRMGRTLSRRLLRVALAGAGLRVVHGGYLLHAPRLPALWLGEWVARRGWEAVAARLARAYERVDRLLAALPTRRWSGHFLVADARPEEAEPVAADGGGTASRAVGFAARYRRCEDRLRTAYLRRSPRALVERLDPALPRTAALLRRALAVPLYLRQELTVWTVRCGGEDGRIVAWGRRADVRRLLPVLCDEARTVRGCGASSLPQLLRDGTPRLLGADVFVAATTPALAPLFRRRGSWVVPAAVRHRGETADLLAAIAAPSRSLRSDLAAVRRADYRTETWSYTPARSALFYERFALPHAVARYPHRLAIDPFEAVDRHFAAGFAVALLPPGSTEADAVCILVPRGRELVVNHVGTRDGDPSLMARGALAALYEAFVRVAQERGFQRIDAGRSRPWRNDGLCRYKWKWGFRPAVDQLSTLEYAVEIVHPERPAARRLEQSRAFVRSGDRLHCLVRADRAEPVEA